MNFEEAAKAVTKLSQRPSNDHLLQLYALYKQGSEGDVQGKRPGMLDIKGRAKFDAWKKLEGLDSDKAKSQYIELVQQLITRD